MSRARKRRPSDGRPVSGAQPARPTVASAETPGWRRLWPVIVFGVALLVGVLHLAALRAAPWFQTLFGDGAVYDRWARQIAGGDWLGQDVFYQAPLYPYLLGLLYGTLGTDLLTVRLVQLLLGAVAALLLALAGRRLFEPKTGLVAGLMLAFYPPVVFSGALVQKSVLDMLFLCAALAVMAPLMAGDPAGHRPGERPARPDWRWMGLGVLLGCLVLTRENAAVLVPVVVGWLLFDTRFAGRRLRPAVLFLVGAGLVLVPVAVRNSVVGGGLYLTTSQFGPNFYIGNRAGADGMYHSLRPRRGSAVYERQDAVDIAEAATGRTLTPSEVSAYFTGAAIADIRADPSAWLALLGRKVALVWNAVEIADSDDQYTAAEWSPVIAAGEVVWHMGVLAPLALVGAILTWPKRARLWPLHAMLAAYTASVVLFFVFARYRLPMVPLLVLFAAAGLVGLPRYVRSTPGPMLATFAVAVAGFAVFCNWPLLRRDAMRATMHYNLGVLRMNDHDPGGAVGEFTTAARLNPAFAEAHNNLGIVLGQLSRLDEARAAFDRALEVDPDFPQALDNSGELLLLQGRAQEARERFEKATQLDADDGRAFANLGRASAATGDLPAAEAAFRRAVELSPGNPGTHNDLAALLGRQGRLEEAAAQSRRALEIDPKNVEAESNLAIIAATAGRLDEAAERLTRAITIDPDRPQAHYNLGTVRARQQRLDEARKEFEAALRLDPTHEGARRSLAALEALTPPR